MLNEIALVPAPAIIYDRKDPDFWTAIFGGDDSAIDIDPNELDDPREFVKNGGCGLPFPRQSRVTWVSKCADWLLGFWGNSRLQIPLRTCRHPQLRPDYFLGRDPQNERCREIRLIARLLLKVDPALTSGQRASGTP